MRGFESHVFRNIFKAPIGVFFVGLKGLKLFADLVAKSKMGLLFRLSDTQKKDGFVSIFLFL